MYLTTKEKKEKEELTMAISGKAAQFSSFLVKCHNPITDGVKTRSYTVLINWIGRFLH